MEQHHRILTGVKRKKNTTPETTKITLSKTTQYERTNKNNLVPRGTRLYNIIQSKLSTQINQKDIYVRWRNTTNTRSLPYCTGFNPR